MTSFSAAGILLRTYPEKSPFALRLQNLSPRPSPWPNIDTPEVQQAALSIATARNGYNVFATMFGSNPIRLDTLVVEAGEGGVSAHCIPSPLSQIMLPHSGDFLEERVMDGLPGIVVRCIDWDEDRFLRLVCKLRYISLTFLIPWIRLM